MNSDLFGLPLPSPRIIIKKSPIVKPFRLNQYALPADKPVYVGQNLYIRPNYIVSMPEFSKPKNYNSAAFEANKENLVDNDHKGVLSKKAMKDIKCCVNWLVASAKLKTLWHKESKQYYSFKVNFITLTLPDTYEVITDVMLKKNLLNPLLTTLRKGYGLKNYLWKLEFQENGKLHVHITSDTFIYWKDLRRLWNKRIISSGYMQKFYNDFGHSDPNSTDVHAVYKINDIAAYISKYMAKEDSQLAKVKGRIWACNQELAANSKPKIFLTNDECLSNLNCLMHPKIKYKAIETISGVFGQLKQIGEMFFITRDNWAQNMKGVIKDIYSRTCWNIRNLAPPSEHSMVF